jgi:hypothetical protein
MQDARRVPQRHESLIPAHPCAHRHGDQLRHLKAAVDRRTREARPGQILDDGFQILLGPTVWVRPETVGHPAEDFLRRGSSLGRQPVHDQKPPIPAAKPTPQRRRRAGVGGFGRGVLS